MRGALNALKTQDIELAEEVIGFDDEIDARYFAIEEGIQSLLARQNPVAGDLRLVLAVLHNNLHLERMADYCVTISKLTKLVEGISQDTDLLEGFEEMGSRAEEMIRISLDSFAQPRRRQGRVARPPGRADRPGQPPRRRSRPRARLATPSGANGACG